MNTVQRIAKNTALIIGSSVVIAIVNFLFTMYVARYLGAGGFGVISFAMAFTSIFTVFTDVGLNILTIREVARDKSLATKYIGNVTVVKLLLSTAVFGLVCLTINLLGYPRQTLAVVYIIGLSMVFNTFSTMFYSLFQAYEKMEFSTVGQTLGSTLLLGCALFAINRRMDIIAFAWVYFAANLLTLVCNMALSIWKFPRPKLELDLTFLKTILRQAWPFGLVSVFTTIYYWIDSVLLSSIQGQTAVGFYSAGYRLFWALSFISVAYYTSVFPVMSHFYVSSRESLRFIYEKSIKYMLIVAVPIGVGTTLLADRIILLIFGAEYSRSAIALQILIWALVFTFISAGFAHLFNSLNRQIIVTKVTGVCALFNIILNLALIPRYSYIGASISRAATDLLSLALVFVASLGIGYGIPARKAINIVLRVLIASGVMAVFVVYLQNLALWCLIPLAALLYFGTLLASGGLDKKDIALLLRTLPVFATRSRALNESRGKFSRSLIRFENRLVALFLRPWSPQARNRLRSLKERLIDRTQGITSAGDVEYEELGFDKTTGSAYQPGGWWDLKAALGDSVSEEDVFIDFGSGKGRMLYLAAREYPFKRVIGVEISEALNAIARRNVDRQKHRLRCPNVEIVTANVSDYEIPDDVTVCYMFNPFRDEVFGGLIEKIILSLERRPRRMRIIYRNPIMHECLINKDFRVVLDLEGLNVYERV